ncbi:MAG: protein kinase [Acidobacteria bacterium]|nr:protein kinase [Acidobacteriota bacterium]
MTAPEWERIKALFDAALNVAKPERSAWLAAACSGSEELRQTIEELLRSYEESSALDPQGLGEMSVFAPGQTVANRFCVIRLIARGGMGEVYEVRDSTLNGLRVALKTIRTEFATQRHAYDRFKREVWVAREVAHENVCRIFDLVEHREVGPSGTERVVPCLTMRLLEGRTLASELTERRPLDPGQALPLIRQIAAALTAMHAKGIAHRDVKPSNIMLLPSAQRECPRVVVMDFGLARPLTERSFLWETRGEVGAGAPYFIAPEVLCGQEGGLAVDIYALGLVIDEMVTQSPALPSGSMEELFWKKLHSEPIPPSQRNPDLPSHWDQAILRCLQRDPAARPGSVAEVLSLLEHPTDAPSVAKPTGRDLVPVRPVEPFLTRRRLIGTMVGVASAVATGVAAVIGSGPGRVDASVLIYPIENRSGDPRLDYLCSGLAHQLMRRLLYIDGLHVYPVRSKNALRPSPGDIGRFSLEGDLEQFQGRIRLLFKLLDNQSRELIWTDQLERGIEESLALERDVSESVALALGRRMSGSGRLGAVLRSGSQSIGSPVRHWLGVAPAGLGPQPTASSTAFTEYMIGRQLWQSRKLTDTLSAIDHFRTAINHDPGFALAYAALSDTQHTLLTYNHGETSSLMRTALEYAEKAASMAPTLPEVQVSLGGTYQMLWDWSKSEASYVRAIQAQPKLAQAHHWYAGLILQFGRFTEALERARTGIAQDPLDYAGRSAYGLYLWHADKPREAASHLEALLRETDLRHAHTVLGQVYAALSAASPEPEATEYFVKSLGEAGIVRTRELEDAGGQDSAGFLKWSDILFAQAHAARRDRASAQRYIQRLERGLAAGKISASAVAWAHAASGQFERVLDLLRIGLERHEREMLYVKVAPLFQPIRTDPRFGAIVQRMGL